MGLPSFLPPFDLASSGDVPTFYAPSPLACRYYGNSTAPRTTTCFSTFENSIVDANLPYGGCNVLCSDDTLEMVESVLWHPFDESHPMWEFMSEWADFDGSIGTNDETDEAFEHEELLWPNGGEYWSHPVRETLKAAQRMMFLFYDGIRDWGPSASNIA